MTKYVLNSGGIKGYPEKGILYTGELLHNLEMNPRVLLCFFASNPNTWEKYFIEWVGHFTNWAPQYSPEYQLAKPEKFKEQCTWADVVYIHGGYIELLKPLTDRCDLKNLFDGKVVGLNSASSHLISTHYWSVDTLSPGDGLGILPIKFFAHFRGDNFVHTPVDWEKAYQEIKQYGDTSLPIYALEEGDFVVIER